MDVFSILVYIISTLTLVSLWYALYRYYQANTINYKHLLMIIISIGLACRIVYAVFTPTFNAPDEQSHYNYIKYLAENKELPIQTNKTNSVSNDWEYYQPPLYYSLMAFAYSTANYLTSNISYIVIILRLINILFWLLTIYFSLQFLNIIISKNNYLKIFTLTIVSLLPSYTFSSSAINNDNLLIALGSIIIYISAKPLTLRSAIILGILLGMSILTKLSAVIFFIYFVILLIYSIIRAKPTNINICNYILILAIGTIMWLPMGIRNVYIYGSMTAEDIANIPYIWSSSYQAIISSLIYLQKSFWAISGIYNNISSYFPLIGIFIFANALIGFITLIFKQKGNLLLEFADYQGIILSLWLAVVVDIILIFRFGILYGQSQGRFLFPLLVPISLWLALSIKSLFRFKNDSISIHIVGIFSLYSVLFMIYSLSNF